MCARQRTHLPTSDQRRRRINKYLTTIIFFPRHSTRGSRIMTITLLLLLLLLFIIIYNLMHMEVWNCCVAVFFIVLFFYFFFFNLRFFLFEGQPPRGFDGHRVLLWFCILTMSKYGKSVYYIPRRNHVKRTATASPSVVVMRSTAIFMYNDIMYVGTVYVTLGP